ncbi:MAG: BON domain-containing protein [Actinomycetota bacterium]
MKIFRLAALGAALVYLSDAARRAKLRDRVRELVGGSRSAVVDDQTLKANVESEVFRDTETPKGDVNVNVELGVVYLRGQLEDQSLIEELEQRVRTVRGVNRVENLLHTPGAEA